MRAKSSAQVMKLALGGDFGALGNMPGVSIPGFGAMGMGGISQVMDGSLPFGKAHAHALRQQHAAVVRAAHCVSVRYLQLPVAQQAQAQATANLLAQERTQQRLKPTRLPRAAHSCSCVAERRAFGIEARGADESAERPPRCNQSIAACSAAVGAAGSSGWAQWGRPSACAHAAHLCGSALQAGIRNGPLSMMNSMQQQQDRQCRRLSLYASPSSEHLSVHGSHRRRTSVGLWVHAGLRFSDTSGAYRWA